MIAPAVIAGVTFQGLMDANEVVIERVERNRSDVVLDLFAEGIRQLSEAAHVHPHSEIAALCVECADMLALGLIPDDFAPCADVLVRTIPGFGLQIGTIELDQHPVINVVAKDLINGRQLWPMPVAG